MPKDIIDSSTFDEGIQVPIAGDRDYSITVEDAFQKLVNRTKWLKDHPSVGPEGPQGPAGENAFSSINGLSNPSGSININAGSNVVISNNGVDTITISAAEVYYTNETPTPETIGGIPAGSTFISQSFTQLLDMLLYPYQLPSFTSFSINGLGGPSANGNTLEVGDSIYPSRNFIWTTSNSTNINENSINIVDETNSTNIKTGVANDGSENTTYGSIRKETASSHVFRIEATNSKNNVFSSTYTVNWKHRRWWGTSADNNLTLLSLLSNNEFSTSLTKSMNINGNGQYIYYAYPASWGSATFTVNGLLNTAWTLYTINHNNNFGVTEIYNVYRTNTVQNGSNIQINIA